MQDVKFAEHLAVFVEVARLGSFSAAARARSSTPSSVTRQIDTLEHILDTRLFIRTTRVVRLTEAGHLLLSRACPILNALADTRAEIDSLRGLIGGRFRIACMPTFGKRFVIPAAAALMSRHPALRVEIDLTERLADPVSDRMDAVIRVGAMTDSTLIATKIGQQHMIVCASPDYLKNVKSKLSAATLAEHRLLDKLKGDDLLGWRQTLATGAAAITKRVVLSCDDFEGLRDAACRGVGIARLASWIVIPDIREGRLVPLSASPLTEDEQGIYCLRALPKPSANFQAFAHELKNMLAARDSPAYMPSTALRTPTDRPRGKRAG